MYYQLSLLPLLELLAAEAAQTAVESAPSESPSPAPATDAEFSTSLSYVTSLSLRDIPPSRLHKTRKPERAIALPGGILQLERIRCGKANCRSCPHGPYWYLYYKKAGKTHSKYIGKTLDGYLPDSGQPDNPTGPA